jgi:hypothetical protein
LKSTQKSPLSSPHIRSARQTGINSGQPAPAQKTFDNYARCLRFIISEIRAMTKTKTLHEYRKGGRKAWVKAIDAMPLEELRADKIRAWKRAYVAPAGHDELTRRRYR